jgi:Family of unknown function (DUF5681)
MADGVLPKPPGRVRGRPFERGRSGNPAGRRAGSLNKTTEAAAALLAGESEALTRRAVELALVGDPTAMRLCLERILPACRERAVRFALPPIESAADIAAAMKAVTSALADGAITPGEAGHHRGRGRHLCPGDRDERFRPAATAHGGRFRQPGKSGGERRAGDALQLLGEILLQICCRSSNGQSAMQDLVAGQRSASRQARAAAARIAPVSMW